MRFFVAVTTVLLAIVALSGCSGDPVPEYRPTEQPVEQDRRVVSADAEHEEAASVASAAEPASNPQPQLQSWPQPQPQLQPQPQPIVEPRPERVSHLLFRVAEPLEVFRWPGDDWVATHSFGPRVLLLADGWTVLDEGNVWLRLDLNGDVVAWTRLADTPLTRTEALRLPKLGMPALPTVEVRTRSGRLITVTLLGRLTDGRIVVLDTFAAEQRPAWIDQWSLSQDAPLAPLPVYSRAVTEQWSIAGELTAAALEVDVWSHHRAYLWPGGPALPYQLRSGRYPVLGRSLDAAWLAVRLDQLHPPVVWLSMETVDLDVEAQDMPLVLSNALEIVSLDDNGIPISSMIVAEPSRWVWLNGSDMLIHEEGQGTSVWDTESGDRRWITEHVVYDISPDARYALRTFTPETHDPEAPSPDRSVEIISLETGSAVRFAAAYNPPGRCGCSGGPVTTLRWSPDSTWLFSAGYGADIEETNRYLALSVHGQRVRVLPPNGESIFDWASLHALEQAGVELIYLNEQGAPIERPWSAEMLAASAAGHGDAVELGDDWWPVHGNSEQRVILAERHRTTQPVDADGFATLASAHGRWGVVEFGLFDEAYELRQLFRGFGLDCGTRGSKAALSTDNQRLAIGTRWSSCA